MRALLFIATSAVAGYMTATVAYRITESAPRLAEALFIGLAGMGGIYLWIVTVQHWFPKLNPLNDAPDTDRT